MLIVSNRSLFILKLWNSSFISYICQSIIFIKEINDYDLTSAVDSHIIWILIIFIKRYTFRHVSIFDTRTEVRTSQTGAVGQGCYLCNWRVFWSLSPLISTLTASNRWPVWRIKSKARKVTTSRENMNYYINVNIIWNWVPFSFHELYI